MHVNCKRLRNLTERVERVNAAEWHEEPGKRTLHRVWLVTSCLLLFLQVVACVSTTPPRRLPDYLGQESLKEMAGAPLPPVPIHAGLAVITDASAPGAAPPLPDGALIRLAETLRQQLSEMTPIVIDRILPAEGIRADGDPDEFREFGKRHGVDYLVLVVASSTEQEYPMTLFLGWVTHAQPGWRRDNWSLLEVALIDAKTGQALLRAEGRGFATLDRPSAPGINQWYPVIWLRPQDPARRYWPPSYAAAPTTLRVVAMNEAAKRVVLKLQDAWIQKRQMELDAAG